MSGFTALRRAVLCQCRPSAKVYERHAEDCTRAAEQTDDLVFRRLLLMLAQQWKQAAPGSEQGPSVR